MDKAIYQTLKSILSVALVYFLLAKLSFQISAVTNFSQLLSLHTGFAIAVMLAIAPSRALAGIVLGVFALTIHASFERSGSNSDAILQYLIAIFTVVIQAYIGSKIYRIWVNVDNSLSHDNDLLNFLKAVPVIALVLALVSFLSSQLIVSSQHTIGFLGFLELWVSYTLGLILVIPVVFSIVEQQSLWKNRRNILVFNFIAALTITFLVCSNIRTFENDRIEDRFKILTNQTATLFQVSLKEKELLQEAVAQLFVSSKQVTREEFKQFVSGISDQNKFIQVVEWLPKIEYEQRAEYEREQRQYYGDDFSITEVNKNEKGVLVPAAKRDVYYPITYLEPEQGNYIAQGFDPSASQGSKDIIRKAIISGQSQARGPIQIFRKTGFTHAFIVYRPIFQNFDGTKTLDPSAGEVIGFVNAVVRVEDFIATLVGPRQTANFNIQWQDVETGKYYFDNDVDTSAPFQHVIDINRSGRDMKLIFTPTASFINDRTTELTAIAMVTSFILASLFSMVVLNITARTLRIQSEVKSRTKELELANEQLELLSNKDVLTHLYNRRYFQHALQDEFERSRRYGNNFALVTFDIDYFKNVNDQYGHPCGDQVIKAVADYLLNTSRSSDVIARIGGEEFALILPGQTHAQVMTLVERIRIDMSNIKVQYEQHTVQFTCSFGIAIFDKDVETVAELIKMADKAMYEAKESGRNNTKLFSAI